jgi:acetyl esterase/lipase
VTELDPEVRELLDRWAASPATQVGELTAEAVRQDELAVLELQRAPGELYLVEDVEAPGPAGTLPVRVYRPRPGRLHPVLFLHGGGYVIGREGYDAPLRELALASGCMIVSPECRLAQSIRFLPRRTTHLPPHGGSTPRHLRSARPARRPPWPAIAPAATLRQPSPTR